MPTSIVDAGRRPRGRLPADRQDFEPQRTSVIVAVTLSASAGIHAAVIPEHYSEWWLAGAFFAFATAAQALGAYQLVRGAARKSIRFGLVLNAALIGIWVISRSAGLPFGPAAGTSESIGVLDLGATGAELVAVAGYVLMLRPSRVRDRVPSRRGASRAYAGLIVGLTVALCAAGANALPAHAHSDASTHDFSSASDSVATPAHPEATSHHADHPHGHNTDDDRRTR